MALTEIVLACEKRQGQLEIDKVLLKRLLARLPDGPQMLRIGPPKEQRSALQNRYMWLILGYISETTGYEPEELHEYFKRRFNPVPNPKLSHEDGDGEFIGGSTTKLSTLEFFEYVEKIRRFAAQEPLNCPTPDPDPEYARVLDRARAKQTHAPARRLRGDWDTEGVPA